MKFLIEKTMSFDDEIDDYKQIQSSKNATLFKVIFPGESGNEDNVWIIEINTFEELMELYNEVKGINNFKGLIIRKTESIDEIEKELPMTIEIYNYYRE